MNRTFKKRLFRLEQASISRSRAQLPPLKWITVIAESGEDADRQLAELEAAGALISPDGREIPLLIYRIVDPPPYECRPTSSTDTRSNGLAFGSPGDDQTTSIATVKVH